MSMISEQIEELRLMAEMFANGEPYGNLLRRAANTIEMLSEKAREPKQGEWIPCSERLPSEKDYIGDVVIWCTDKSIVGVGWYYESTKSWATIDDTFPPILGKVIAWMPLPEPWRGADDERL